MPGDLPSRLDLFAIGRDYVLTRATKLDPAQVDIAGSDVNILVATASFLAYEVVLQLAQKVNNLLLDGAVGEDLDRYGLDRYGLARKGASAALGVVQFTRATATAGAGSVPTNTKLVTLNGVEYITYTTASFGATDLKAEALVRAVTAGKATQVGANQIRRIAQPAALFDTTLQVNNEDPTSGGEDAEEDSIYRERLRAFWNSARRGTLSAIEFGAKTVTGIDSAQAIEALTSEALPARVVSLYVADSSGVASFALAQAVRTALDEYRAAGIAVLTNTSIPQIVDVQLSLTFKAGVDTSALTESVRGAIVEFINSLSVNGTLYRAQLYSVLQRYANEGLIPTESTLATPVGDIVPDNGRTLRTTLANVKVV